MNQNFYFNYKKTAKIAAAVLAAAFGIFAAYKLSFYLAPFIIALLISFLLEPAVIFIVKKIRLPRKFAVPAVLLLFIVVVGAILAFIITRLIKEIVSVSKILPGFFSSLYESINILLGKVIRIYEWLPPEITANIETIISNFTNSMLNAVNTLANSIVKGAFATAVSIPEALIFILITILSTYFLLIDKDKIYGFFAEHLPAEWMLKAINLKNDMFSAMFGYLKAQLIIISITFAELLVGFAIMRLKYALLLAFIISLVDALPVLGTGTVLIPWSIYELFSGNMRMGVSLLVLYSVVLIVRYMLEPKIVGRNIGLHPLLTLIAMYAGLKLLGVAGLILGPIAILLIKNILAGIFKHQPAPMKETAGSKTLSQGKAGKE